MPVEVPSVEDIEELKNKIPADLPDDVKEACRTIIQWIIDELKR